MKITEVKFAITIDLTDVPAYEARASWEGPDRARPFKPFAAEVAGPMGDVSVHGHKIKKNGEPYADSTTLEYWSWGDGLADQPAFVHEARKLAADFRAEAENAWKVRNGD